MHRILILILTALPIAAQPTLAVTQPTGPGSFDLQVSGLSQASAEVFNLISLQPHVPTGSGAFFGLGLTDSHLLLDQLLAPLPTPPFHDQGDPLGNYSFAFNVGPVGFSFPVDAVSVEWDPVLGVLGVSNVVNLTLFF
jgi:hypothetical protein